MDVTLESFTDPELAQIEAARQQMDLDIARARATTWLEARPDVLARFEGLSIATLVAQIEDYRALGDEESRATVSAYLLAAHAPQEITGASAGLGG